MISLSIVILSLALLMFVAYRGLSVILFAPICAMLAVLLSDPSLVAPYFSGVFMEKMASFLKLYFPVFLLGAIFGKLIELSGFSKSIVSSVIKLFGSQRAILSIVLVCALLTYGGVSLFVVVFAVYPFAAEMFKQSNIPKRLIPGTIALGAFTFTMDALPGTPQIQNIIPTTFFHTSSWAAPYLGIVGSIFILIIGLFYLTHCQKKAFLKAEGYATDLDNQLINEPESPTEEKLANKWYIAILPLLVVAISNQLLTKLIQKYYGNIHTATIQGHQEPLITQISSVSAIWAVEAALLLGIATLFIFAYKQVSKRFIEGSKSAISGALLASLNTASEYGFGAVIAALPGFMLIASALKSIPNPLINEAITVTTLAGITGSASGGMSIALAAMSQYFIDAANSAHIPLEVMHRIASMSSGGMDTLPHNGAVITLLAVTGLTHKSSYKDIFVVTCIKTLAVFFVIAFYYLTGLY